MLSWLAVCETGTDRVLVFHGQDVQTQPYWFCEAIWDGAYSDGNLDQTDLIFGSGARCRGSGTARVDCKWPNGWLIGAALTLGFVCPFFSPRNRLTHSDRRDCFGV